MDSTNTYSFYLRYPNFPQSRENLAVHTSSRSHRSWRLAARQGVSARGQAGIVKDRLHHWASNVAPDPTPHI